jgi:hypothetical protein
VTHLPPLHIETAKLLANSLARIDNAPAYVVMEGSHPHLASSWCVGEGKPWAWESVVYTAPAPEGAPSHVS